MTENQFFLIIDIGSEIPLYQQIRDQIILAIAQGELHEGDALPTIRQLALDFRINLHTVNKAYDLLRREGLVSLTRKQGCLVHVPGGQVDPNWLKDWQNRMRILCAEGKAHGYSAQNTQEQIATIFSEFSQKAVSLLDK